jgi:tetratricopeptide (TPR) repeat protein
VIPSLEETMILRIFKPFAAAATLGLLIALGAPPAWADTTKEELAVVEYLAQQKPQDPDARFDLAMAYARTPVLEKAWEELQMVISLDKTYADKLIERLEPLAEESPHNVEAHWRLAFAYYFKGREGADKVAAAKARSAFEKILAIDPNYVWAYNYLAYMTYEAGDLAGAESLARKATEVAPRNAVAHFLVGQAMLKQGNPFGAAMSLARAMQLRSAAGYGLPTAPAPPPTPQSAAPATPVN